MRWIGLALLGLLVAAAVSVAASRLVSQQIGLASQPISAGDALAPAGGRKPSHRTSQHRATQREHGRAAPGRSKSPAPERVEPEPVEPEEPPEPPQSPPDESPSAGGGDYNAGEGADD